MFVLSDDGRTAVSLDRVTVFQVLDQPDGTAGLVALGEGIASLLVQGSTARCYEGLRVIFQEYSRGAPDELTPPLIDLAEHIGAPSDLVLPRVEVPGGRPR